MSFVFQSRSGPDSTLHLEIRVGQPNTDFEVEIVVRPKAISKTFPAGYFELLGSIMDETFTTHPQPPLPGHWISNDTTAFLAS
jgi:hypothetical protein